MKKWKISSAIKVRERNLKLKLDETSGLKCHYTNFGAYIPEEIKMFQSCFNQMETTWQIIDRAPYIKAEENRLQKLTDTKWDFHYPSGYILRAEFKGENRTNLRIKRVFRGGEKVDLLEPVF